MRKTICAGCSEEIKGIRPVGSIIFKNGRSLCKECADKVKSGEIPALVCNTAVEDLNNPRKYQVEIQDKEGLKRAQNLLAAEFSKLVIMNEDSDKSVHGGAVCMLQVEITLGEEWM